MRYNGKTDEYFEVMSITKDNDDILGRLKANELSLLWFKTDDNQLVIDGIEYTFDKNQIICLTEFHIVEIKHINEIKFLRFNKPFYCILEHDSEVGCKGVLYYGSSHFPILTVSKKDSKILRIVWKMVCIELESRDQLQLEMLQTMLKRILILCTRIYKNQAHFERIQGHKVDIIRDYNYLVETHFREKHTVKEYAAILNKSPKTISNLFKKISYKTPLQQIQSRILLEARRLLAYTNKGISEVGYEIGFGDVQSFSRFFKKHEQVSPSEFRELRYREKLPII